MSDVILNFRDEPDVVEALDSAARLNQRSRSGELRVALRAWLATVAQKAEEPSGETALSETPAVREPAHGS
jgi:hypothetical protein